MLGRHTKMPTFQVTLQFSFERHHSDDEDEYESNRTSKRKQKTAFERTDTFYKDHTIIDYIKSNDAMEMMEYSISEGEVLSAEWDPSAFTIHMVVETDQDAKELEEDLRMNSLEDGEYEASGETGWVLFTRGLNGEVYQGGGGSETVWEYGLVDYRQNPIVVKPKLD
jgi:hypothetical protein